MRISDWSSDVCSSDLWDARIKSAHDDRMTPEHPDRVLLLHGLARTPRSMAGLARALEGAGYAIVNHGYPSRRHDIATLTAQLRAVLAGLPAIDGRTHIVGHSLGGLLIRAAQIGRAHV